MAEGCGLTREGGHSTDVTRAPYAAIKFSLRKNKWAIMTDTLPSLLRGDLPSQRGSNSQRLFQIRAIGETSTGIKLSWKRGS